MANIATLCASACRPTPRRSRASRAVRNGVPSDIILADAWYGRSSDFRAVIRTYGFDYALGIAPMIKMRLLDNRDRSIDECTRHCW